MKKTLTIVLCCIALAGKGQYHIKIKPAYIGFALAFTNDNWKTSEYIKAFSGSSYGKYNMIVWTDALENARKFTTYNSCIIYNKNQYNAYMKWYNH